MADSENKPNPIKIDLNKYKKQKETKEPTGYKYSHPEDQKWTYPSEPLIPAPKTIEEKLKRE